MSWLVLRLRFPMGTYDATVKHRKLVSAEWPPAPERVAAAGINGGAGLGIVAARVLYELDPPLVWAQTIGVTRNGGYSRWVPRQTGNVDKNYGGRINKVSGDNAGVLVDRNTPVVMAWNVDGHSVDVPGLRKAFGRVAYLGRPTSPVIIDVELLDSLPDVPDDVRLYRPDVGGDVRLSVPSPAVLVQRDRIHAQRQSFGAVMAPNAAVRRELVNYIVVDPAVNHLPASRIDVGRMLTNTVFFEIPSSRRVPAWEFYAMAAAARAAGANTVIPAFAELGILGLAADVPEGVEVLSWLNGAGNLVSARLQSQRKPAVREAFEPMACTSTLWTTSAPIIVDSLDDLRSSLSEMAEEHGCVVADAFTHDEGMGHSGLGSRPIRNSMNVSVRFDDMVTGPLWLNGIPMVSAPVSVKEEL